MAAIPLIKPYLPAGVKQRVLAVLDSGYLTEGPVTEEFERAVGSYIGCDHVLAMCNCTVGLETALRVLGVGPGDEVIVPDYTYPATASVVNIVGAAVVLVDVDPDTMLIDYDALESAIGPRTKAAIPVSLFGNPLDHDRLAAIKQRHGIFLVEDAACALGAAFNGAMVGTQADISAFSLHPRKFITTGEGGLVSTNNPDWADWMRSYKHFGMGVEASRLTARFDRIGTNYKLSNLQAAVGLAQMEHIEEMLEKRRRIAARYRRDLEAVAGIRFPQTTAGGVHSFQSCCLFVNRRDRVMASLAENGIQTQIGTYALHRHRAFAGGEHCRIHGDLSGSDYAFDHCLTLPLYHEMSGEEYETVVEELKSAVR
jgi:dTDP-4-amino-4,6-dideoxygalactose transaminase